MNFVTFTFFYLFLVIERSIELLISKKNEAKLRAKGAIEVYPFFNKTMMLFNLLWLMFLPLEFLNTNQTNSPLNFIIGSILLICFQVIRYWSVYVLKEQWTVKLYKIVNPFILTDGLYKYIKHPNYLIVVGELIVFPLMFNCTTTLVVFVPLGVLFFYFKIKFENSLLGVR